MLKSTLRKTVQTCLAIASMLPQPTLAQWPVLQFTANYVPVASSIGSYFAYPTNPGTFATCNSYNYTYTWSNGTNNHLKLVGFTANSKSYVLSGVTNVLVKLRRVNNAVVTGNRNILYIESTFGTATSCVAPTRQLDFKAPYSDNVTTFLINNVLNHGTDNIFTNASNGDGNNNNIEGVDVIFPTGISSGHPSEMGFILCKRGNNNAHDGFRIASILSKNASNDPTSFGAAKTCVAGKREQQRELGTPNYCQWQQADGRIYSSERCLARKKRSWLQNNLAVLSLFPFRKKSYLRLMNRFKSFMEWNAFGVCTAIGNRMGIATSKIRQYFMYTSILTMGSPILIYMVLAFWRNMRTYIRAAKRNPWYYL